MMHRVKSTTQTNNATPEQVEATKDLETNSASSWQASAVVYNLATQAMAQRSPLAHGAITNFLHPDNPAEHSFFARFLAKIAFVLPWVSLAVFLVNGRSLYRSYMNWRNAENRNYERWADLTISVISFLASGLWTGLTIAAFVGLSLIHI